MRVLRLVATRCSRQWRFDPRLESIALRLVGAGWGFGGGTPRSPRFRRDPEIDRLLAGCRQGRRPVLCRGSRSGARCFGRAGFAPYFGDQVAEALERLGGSILRTLAVLVAELTDPLRAGRRRLRVPGIFRRDGRRQPPGRRARLGLLCRRPAEPCRSWLGFG